MVNVIAQALAYDRDDEKEGDNRPADNGAGVGLLHFVDVVGAAADTMWFFSHSDYSLSG